MRKKEQEPKAAAIVGLFVSDVDALGEKHPQVIEILDLASDLEWSNVYNTTIAWRRIKELVDELDQQVSEQP